MQTKYKQTNKQTNRQRDRIMNRWMDGRTKQTDTQANSTDRQTDGRTESIFAISFLCVPCPRPLKVNRQSSETTLLFLAILNKKGRQVQTFDREADGETD